MSSSSSPSRRVAAAAAVRDVDDARVAADRGWAKHEARSCPAPAPSMGSPTNPGLPPPRDAAAAAHACSVPNRATNRAAATTTAARNRLRVRMIMVLLLLVLLLLLLAPAPTRCLATTTTLLFFNHTRTPLIRWPCVLRGA